MPQGDQKSPGATTDDPRRSPESGESAVAGRSHGRVIDEQGAPAGKTDADAGSAGKASGGARGNTGKVGEDFESGRQDTM